MLAELLDSSAFAAYEFLCVVLAGFGLVVLLTAWLPMVLRELPLSLPIFCVASASPSSRSRTCPATTPTRRSTPWRDERMTELVVIIALMGAGLKLDRPLAWRSWRLTWRLLGHRHAADDPRARVLGHALLGLGAAAALLLAAALAPTDPVLASDIQVGPPRRGPGGRGALHPHLGGGAERRAGLSLRPSRHRSPGREPDGEPWLREWLGRRGVEARGRDSRRLDAIGRRLGWLTFRLPNRAKLSRTGDGFVALGVTCLAYGADRDRSRLRLPGRVRGGARPAINGAAAADITEAARFRRATRAAADDGAARALLGGAIAGGGLFRGLSLEA